MAVVFCLIYCVNDFLMGCSRKNPHPPTDGILEILAGGGSKTLEIQAGGGGGGGLN